MTMQWFTVIQRTKTHGADKAVLLEVVQELKDMQELARL
jgi:hypothetical protein